MDKLENQKISKIYIFANTLWFIFHFKGEIIKKLISKYDIEVFYLREGPKLDNGIITFFKGKVTLTKINFLNIFKIQLRILFKNNILIHKIIVFTIGPILLSSLIFPFHTKNFIYVIEGLGRLFVSKKISSRLLKRFVEAIYRRKFNNCSKVITVNSCDAKYLLEKKICNLEKLEIIPGTGINTSKLLFNFQKYKREPIYIDFIGRTIEEKGIYTFIMTKLYLNSFSKEITQKYPFRIIAPESDLIKIGKSKINYLNKIGIVCERYNANPEYFYSKTKALYYPSKYGEGLSRVVLEASYLGLPILVNQIRGIEEIMPYKYKYFITNENPSTISKQLFELIKDKKYISSILKMQRKKIDDQFSYNRVNKNYFRIIDE